MIKRVIESADAKLIFCDSDLGDSPMDDFMYYVQGGFAQLERAVIKDRTTKGRRRRAEEGVQPCRAMRPFGYHIVNKGDVMTGAYELADLGSYKIIEEEAQWAREMFTRYAVGNSLRKICRWLNDNNVSTPRNGEYWRVSTLKRI
ncbi:recombinase family protein, partial [Salmonella enterica]|uniref:recombinase family protein n=1 Tax=Salmonella enterica TaxID=28901 RepID=UPI00215B292A